MILALQRTAGNQAVTAVLEAKRAAPAPGIQRVIGWKDASTEGYGWNVQEHRVGKIRRFPLEGLARGLQQESAKRWVRGKGKEKGHWADESTMLAGLSPESAKGKAIVLVPEGLDATMPVEVLIQLHGYTEGTHRPFAGWRALTPSAAGGKKLQALRQGIDKKDVAPVRDVALDQAEQQLEESGYKQTMIVLPQGGLHSQFGKAGDTNFDSGAYTTEIVDRLFAEAVWKNAKKAPPIGRVSMAGHSGAGATLASMAMESVRRHSGRKPGTSSTLTGDLVLLDAINSSGELSAFKDWALMRLEQDLTALKSLKTDAEKLAYLQTAQKLRGYYSQKGSYVGNYTQLDNAIGDWFKHHAAESGPYAGRLRANFSVVPVPVTHEELMRGVPAGEARGGAGTILDALRTLHSDARPARAKAPATVKTAAPASKKAVSPAQPAPGQQPSGPSGAAGDARARQIATAILLAKTGGEGAGNTAAEKKAAKEAAEASVAHDIQKGTKKDVDAWFANLEPDATFLGKQIQPSSAGEPPGVHHEMAVKLAAAEASLLNTKAGEKPAGARVRLGVKSVSGMRVPKTPTGKTSGASMHCFGLAVDIDHDNNPFVGNYDKPSKARPEGGPSLQIIKHATLLLAGAPHDVRQAPPKLEGSHRTDSEEDRKARATRAVEEWERLHADSILVQRYLSMTPEQLDDALKERLPALTAWKEVQTAEAAPQPGKQKTKKRPNPPAWVEHVTESAWWHAIHESDKKHSKQGDFGRGSSSDPTKFGFMTLHEELVKALVDAGLSWGGTYQGDRDIMHFDLRTGSIGGRPVV